MFNTETKTLKVQSLLDAGFEIKGDKQWQAREGYGYSFNVYYGGKKVAYFLEEGNGGMARVEWEGIHPHGGTVTYGIDPDDKRKLAAAERKAKNTREAKEMLQIAAVEAHPIHDFWADKDIESDAYVMEETVSHLLMELSCVMPLLRKCKRGQMVYAQTFDDALEGSFYITKGRYTDAMKAHVVAKHPDAFILNDAVAA